MYSKRTLTDHHIRFDRRDFSNDQMSIFLSRIIASVKYFESRNLDEEHGGTEYVSRVIGCEPESTGNDYVLMVVYSDCRFPRCLNVGFVI